MNHSRLTFIQFFVGITLCGVLCAVGCGRSPAIFQLGKLPCFNDSQCSSNAGYRCVRMICTLISTPPPPSERAWPPVDAGPDATPDNHTPEVSPENTVTPCKTGERRSCYSGPSGSAGQGACRAGTQECVNEGWGACINERTPQKEICGDQVDNNCDGVVDENCGGCTPGTKQDCGDSNTGECRLGKSTCTDAQMWGPCIGVVYKQTEICDGLDNDCNGQTDESDPQLGQGCHDANSNGICGQGQYICESGKLRCQAIGIPTIESCNALDDDCDGHIDNNISGLGVDCPVPNGKGPCAKGVTRCVQGAEVCESVVAAAPNETCDDGIDNDCNGQIDDGCNKAAAQCAPCQSDSECGFFNGKQIKCEEDPNARSFGKHCYRPCNNTSECDKAFFCNQVDFQSTQKYCIPGFYPSSYYPMWHCSNYNKAMSKATCSSDSDCGFRSSSGFRGGDCPGGGPLKGVCRLLCKSSDQCPTGSCKWYGTKEMCQP